MPIEAQQRRRNGWHDVGAVNEAEREIAEPRRIVVEECLAARPRAAEGIGGHLFDVRLERRARCSKDRERAAEAVSGEEQGLRGRGAIGDRRSDRWPYRFDSLLETAMETIRRRHGVEIGHPVFGLARIAAGKGDERCAVAFGDDDAGAVRRQAGQPVVAGESEFGQVPAPEDVVDLGFVRGLVGKLGQPHHGPRVVEPEIPSCREHVQGIVGKGTPRQFDEGAH